MSVNKLELPGEVNGIARITTAGQRTFACVTSAGIIAVVLCPPQGGIKELARFCVAPLASLIDVAVVELGNGLWAIIAVGITAHVFVVHWDGEQMQQPGSLVTPGSADNRAITAIPSSHLVVVGGQGGALTVVDVVDPTVVTSLPSPHTSLLRSLIAFGSTLVSAGQDRSVVIWDLTDLPHCQPTTILRDAHDGWVWGVALSADEKRIYSAGSDGRLGAITLSDRTMRHVAFVPDRWLMSVATLKGSRDNPDYVVAGDAGGVLRCWDETSMKEILSLSAHSDEINAIVVSADQDVVVSGSRDGTIAATSRGTIDDESRLRDFSSHWGSDRPSSVDLLGRTPIADFLAARIVRFLNGTASEGHRAFLLSGPWGAGKTSLVRLVLAQVARERPGTVVAEVNAWSTIGRGISWTEAVEAVVSAYVGRARRESLLKWFRIRVALLLTLSRVAISWIFAMLLLVAILLLFGSAYLASISANTWTSIGTLAAGVATLVTVVASSGQLRRLRAGGTYKASRWETHEARDTVLIAARMLEVCMRSVRQPFLLVVDDLDRCVPEAVTELLENLHCVLESRGFDFQYPSSLIVTADESWLRSAFEHVYPEMTTQDASFGSRIGSRFLEKLFYLVLPTGRISHAAEVAYLGSLVTDDGAAEATNHVVFGFRELLPDNPRTVRRIVVAFEGLRELKAAESIAVPQSTLMLWAIIRTRWPDAAIALAADPSAVTDPDGASPELREWLHLPEVRRVLTWALGGPLGPEDIRRCASEV